jgi:hypothetical protein
MRLLPGDPLTLYLAQTEIDKTSAENLAALRHEYGLDRSLPMQYIDWVSGILHGDLGMSIFLQQKVSSLIASRLPITMHLGILSMIVSSVFGITFGVICGIKRGKWWILSYRTGKFRDYCPIFLDRNSTNLFFIPQITLAAGLRLYFSFRELLVVYAADNYASFLSFPILNCFTDKTGSLEYAGNCQAGLYPYCLGQGLNGKDHYLKAYSQKCSNSGSYHDRNACRIYLCRLGTYRDGV